MTGLGITHRQAKALAALVHELRGDWDTPGILDAIAVARSRGSGAEVAIAAIRAAVTASNRTPAVIPLDGAHWRGKLTEPAERTTWRPPRKADECTIHPGSYADRCSGCAADQAVGDQTAAADPRRPDRSGRIAALRQAHADIQQRLCRHGVDRTRGVCRDCEPIASPAAEPTREDA